MPHSHVPEPDVNDGDYDEVGPWDLPPEDWKALRELLSSAFSHDEWRRILTELGYPSAEFPIDAKGAEDFWYHVRKRTEEGAVRWGWRKIVRHLGTASRVQYHPDIRRLVTEHGLGTSPTPDAQPANGPMHSPEPVTATVIIPPQTSTGPETSAVPETGELYAEAAAYARDDRLPPVGGYGELLPKSPRPDRREAILALWEQRLGPWEGLNQFQQDLVQVCRKIIDDRGVALVYAVTNSGKTTIARVGMTMALSNDESAMMLLPIKALVAQEEAEWQGWLGGHDALERLQGQVYGVSRDYPESDRPVGNGHYKVAVAIYEKLGVYLVNGMRPLDRTRLVVVDELQMLSETSDRAAKLEAVLTLIKLRPGDRPALLGLSAALSPEAGETLEQWLGDQRTTFTPSSNERPVPLDTYVVDQGTWLVQRDAHLLSMNMPGSRTPPEAVREQHRLPALRSQYSQALSKGLNGLQRKLSTAELAATLVLSILQENDKRRIICFVPTRTAADQLAGGIRQVLDAAFQRPKDGSPWVNGRYKSAESARRDREGDLYDRLLTSDIPGYELVIRGLRTGVAAHSAALAPPMRRLLEDEFRAEDGLLRVLVATDTLAVGLNLPADTVVATSISGLSGAGSQRARQLLLPADLDNKGGRAGRRGQTVAERGQFYILVPSDLELQNVDGLTTVEIKELATVEGVSKKFVRSKRRSLAVRSQYRDREAISGLVLQVLCQDNRMLVESKWLARVRVILDNLLISYEPDHPALPEPKDILKELQRRKLIHEVGRSTRPGAAKSLKLTELGQAVGRSGLELDDAPDLERLAGLVRSGAGTIELLWHASRARSIKQVTAWVALPGEGSNRHLPSLKGAVLTMAMTYCAEHEQMRQDCANWVAAEGAPLPERLLREAGRPVVSRELQDLLASDEDAAATDEVNALLRAVVAHEWLHGVPFAEMQQRFSGAIKSEEEPDKGQFKAPSLSLYYSDVEQLCEQMAGYIRAAADISFTEDGVDHSARMQLIAQQVESGLPAWLAKVSKMRISGLHRERLAKLAGLPEDQQPDPPSLLVDMDPLTGGLTDAERVDARRIIDSRLAQERAHRERIAREWADVVIPDGAGQIFDDVSEDLEKANGAAAYLKRLGELAVCLGLEVTDAMVDGSFYVAEWSAGESGAAVTVRVPVADLTAGMVADVREERTLVVVRGRRPGVQEALAAQGLVARFLEPDHLLSVLAHLVKTRGQVPGEEVVEELSGIRLSSLGGISWSVPVQAN
ncbi:DEAD/DEAH box helicase [Streptomyces sp. NBC_01221]|uniref:DEAD/DEAH box helicase n=1 Tax=Streptomyces sp. NBC_01221 TaxID=2903782 RepID=UPI0022508273|nr:DEAD/DEAH box helicase [Streptomyces sp. NBC_01221]MCX4788123.1 DEAD/DEAH box helicase [Streptomyces sp. NBC_01221]